MRFLSTVCIGLCIMISFHSCHEDMVEEVEVIDTYIPYTIYEVDVRGLISKPDGEPITEAELDFAGDKKFSDELGYFIFEGVGADTRNAILNITAEGFLPVTRLITVLSPNTIHLNITLTPIPDTESFDAEDGLVAVVSDEAQISFYPNGIIKDGAPFSGNVNLKSYHLAKDDDQLYERLPGDLIGIDQQQDLKILETYGMLYATLEDDEGNQLQPDPGLTAQLSIDIPTAYQARAPSEIPLWYFDEERGLWIEEGKAIKQGNTYVGTVTHFSWWNIDIPLGNLVTICLQASDVSTGEVLKNSDILFSSEGIEFGVQTTNDDGKLCVSLPANRVITLQLGTTCQYVSSTDIGPFDEARDDVQVELGTNEAGSVTINGDFSDCAGQPLSVDIVTVTRDGRRSAIDVTRDESFSYSVVCPRDKESITFLAFDKTSGNSVVKDFVVDADQLTSQFDLTVCGNAAQNILVGNINGEEVILLIESVKLNPNETILILDNRCYLSFLGNSTGNFEGGYFCVGGGPSANVDVTITSFGDQIEGEFTGDNSSGSFNASTN